MYRNSKKPEFKHSQRHILDTIWVRAQDDRVMGIVLVMTATEFRAYFGPALSYDRCSLEDNAGYIIDNGAVLPWPVARAAFPGPYPDVGIYTCRGCSFFGQFAGGLCPCCQMPAGSQSFKVVGKT